MDECSLINSQMILPSICFLAFCQIDFKVNLLVLLNEALEPCDLRWIHSGNINLLEGRNVSFRLQMRFWFSALENIITQTYICTGAHIEIIEYFIYVYVKRIMLALYFWK